ncbi:MAG: hypothetical protein FWD73_10805 [Polyangiaceae bacterium]|nr:hypothetical protein [Polyangiaceae bacterium]
MQARSFSLGISAFFLLSAGSAVVACGISSVGSAPNNEAAESTAGDTEAGGTMSGDTADSSAEASSPRGDAACDPTQDIFCGIPGDFPLGGGTTWGVCMTCLQTSCRLSSDSCNDDGECNDLATRLRDCLGSSNQDCSSDALNLLVELVQSAVDCAEQECSNDCAINSSE